MSSSLGYIMDYKHGRLEMGLPFGSPDLDKHWVFKRNFTVILGLSGSGKTTVDVYLNLVQAILCDKKCLVWSSENSNGELQLECVNAILGTDVKNVDDESVAQAYDLLNQYMLFVDSSKSASIQTLMEAADKRLTSDFHSMIVDPWNSLRQDRQKFQSKQDYIIDSLIQIRAFQKSKDIAFHLVVHPTADASRTRHKGDHRYAGQVARPFAQDAEFGGDFNNKADDFLIFHRYKLDEQDWNITKMWVDKVKNHRTGGRETPMEVPVEARYDGCRFHFGGVDILQKAINEKWTNT